MMKSGYSFLDDNIGGFAAGELTMIKGVCEQTEEFTVSLMQSVLKNNDGYVLLYNAPDFRLLTSTIFDEFKTDDDNVLVSQRLDKKRILKRNLTAVDVKILQDSLNNWLELKKFKHLQKQKLTAIFTSLPKHWAAKEDEFVAKLKEVAEFIKVPVFYMQDISQADYEIADIVIKLEALNGYKEPVDLIVERTMHGKMQTIRANENSLKYADALKNCEHLWFYES